MLVNNDFLVRPTFPARANCFINYVCRLFVGHTPLQLLTIFMKTEKLTMSNASHEHIIGRPIYQQCETGPDGPLRESASFTIFTGVRLDVTPHSKHSATEFRGSASQCGQGWSARPEDNSRTREGQQQDKRRTRPGHRVQGRGQSV